MLSEHDLDAFGYWDTKEQYEEHKRMKSMTPLQMVRDFHEAMNQPLDVDFDVPQILYADLDKLRINLIDEEVEEFKEAIWPEHVLKELADIVYVVYGYAATYGWDLDEAVRRVHSSNMSKLDPVTGKPIYRYDGKVLKGDNYKPPTMEGLV